MLEFDTSDTIEDGFNEQLDAEAYDLMELQFEDYAGVSIAKAKKIAKENDLNFVEEFWLPFLQYVLGDQYIS